jgi:hypothetical protein
MAMNVRSLLVFATACVLLIGTVCVGQDADEGPTFEQQLEEWLPAMGAEQIPSRRDAQQKLQNLIFQLGTPGRAEELNAACAVMATKLGPEVAQPARIWLLRQLEFSGGGQCVDAIAAVLEDRDPLVRDAARRALQNNPNADANAKLLTALGKTRDTKWKLALCNSLGYRADAASTDALVKLLADKDDGVAAAAANALGKIGGDKAAAALAAGEEKASGTLQIRLGDAYLRCADQVLAGGDKAKAISMYDRMSKPEKPRVIRIAATQGKLRALGK